MTRHLDAVSVTEHRVVLALAREFADRAELAEAAVQRVREVCADQCFWAEHGPEAGLVNAVTVESILDALDGGDE